ncbi:MAG: hypothetical protein LBS77_02880 [Desulfovibrio sp.]|nr:hypothetical protein [Desulfovibrio sp.]
MPRLVLAILPDFTVGLPLEISTDTDCTSPPQLLSNRMPSTKIMDTSFQAADYAIAQRIQNLRFSPLTLPGLTRLLQNASGVLLPGTFQSVAFLVSQGFLQNKNLTNLPSYLQFQIV